MLRPELRKMLDEHVEKHGFTICPKCNYDHVDEKVICCRKCGIMRWQIEQDKRSENDRKLG
jgi:hypothetical protein